MNLNDAEIIAKELMQKHCPEYSFSWDNAKRRFGSCNIKHKRITLSKDLVSLNNVEEVKNTILHEIAHALRPKCHHDYIWRLTAISLGCDGGRVYDNNKVITPEKKCVYQCPSCHREIKRFRKSKTLACGVCCKGKYDEKYKFILKEDDKK